MSVSDRVLAISNKARHDELCREISKDLPTFVRIGARLKELQQIGVYKETHKTFEAFVLSEFGFSRARAYQLIDAADTTESLSKILDKSEVPKIESQLLEISKAPVEQQVQVVRKAVERAAEENRKPTAQDYKQVVGELLLEDEGEELQEEEEVPPKPQPSKEDVLKLELKKTRSYAEHLQRAVDDLNRTKRNTVIHPQLIKLCGQILEGLERW